MYVVLSGDLQIVDGSPVYETVVAGGIVGEMALVDGGPRSATVCALTACEVIAIDERRFTTIVRQNPFFALLPDEADERPVAGDERAPTQFVGRRPDKRRNRCR